MIRRQPVDLDNRVAHLFTDPFEVAVLTLRQLYGEHAVLTCGPFDINFHGTGGTVIQPHSSAQPIQCLFFRHTANLDQISARDFRFGS